MKQCPLKKYPVPAYPSFKEASASPDLLDAVPRRWTGSPRFAALIGAGLIARTLSTQAGETDSSAAKPAVVAAPVPDPAHGRAVAKSVQRATSVVAPLLDEALRHDGRGSFGCIAVNPPSFLSEDEALELIGAELKAAGLNVKEGVPLAGTGTLRNQPLNMRSFSSFKEEQEARNKPVTDDDIELAEHDFDLGDTNRAVYVEYLSNADYRRLTTPSGSTADYLDFPALATRVSTALQKSKPEQPAVFGVFFDPLAHRERQGADTAGLSPRPSDWCASRRSGLKSPARSTLTTQPRKNCGSKSAISSRISGSRVRCRSHERIINSNYEIRETRERSHTRASFAVFACFAYFVVSLPLAAIWLTSSHAPDPASHQPL